MATVSTARPMPHAHNATRPTLAISSQDRPRSAWQAWYQKALVVSDAVAIVGCLLAAQWVRLALPARPVPPLLWLYYTGVSLVIAATWLGFLSVYRTRSPRIIGAGTEEYRRVFSATLAFVGVTASAL